MNDILKRMTAKLFCSHEWSVVAKTEYETGTRYLLKCTKCGKLTRKWL